MPMHSAAATNWNGEAISTTFNMRGDDFDALCRRAHKAFHDDGYYTIRLDLVDNMKVNSEYRYMA